MASPPRRKVDLTRLPVWARYLIAIPVVVAVGVLVWVARGGQNSTAAWYQTGIRVAAVALIVWSVVWVVRKLVQRNRR